MPLFLDQLSGMGNRAFHSDLCFAKCGEGARGDSVLGPGWGVSNKKAPQQELTV